MPRPPKTAANDPRPFLKWAGGKTQLLEELLKRVPEKFGAYHEPFLGAGALFFKLKALGRIKKATLSDINSELMNVWTELRDSPQNLMGELSRLSQDVSEKAFYEVRALDPAKLTRQERAARLIFLNKTCFNGLYRENRSGRFNVPYGKYANPKILDRENLMAVSRALQNVTLETGSFSAVVRHAKEGDFVYLDPPYHPLSKSSSFTAYAKGGFGEEGQRQLAAVFAQLVERGVHVLLSNSNAPLIHELYADKGWMFETVSAIRAINSKADGRGRLAEVLVSAGGKRKRAVKAVGGDQLPLISEAR